MFNMNASHKQTEGPRKIPDNNGSQQLTLPPIGLSNSAASADILPHQIMADVNFSRKNKATDVLSAEQNRSFLFESLLLPPINPVNLSAGQGRPPSASGIQLLAEISGPYNEKRVREHPVDFNCQLGNHAVPALGPVGGVVGEVVGEVVSEAVGELDRDMDEAEPAFLRIRDTRNEDLVSRVSANMANFSTLAHAFRGLESESPSHMARRLQVFRKLISLGLLTFIPKYWDLVDAHPRIPSLTHCFVCIWIVVWNGSDCAMRCDDRETLKRISDDMLPFIFRELGRSKMMKSYPVILWVGYLGVIHNTVPYLDDGPISARKLNASAILHPYLNASDTHSKLLATLCLAYILDEEENKKLGVSDDIVNYLINTLSGALRDPDKRSSGFSLIELLDGINHLVSLDDNKRLFAENGVLPLYVMAMQQDPERHLVEAAKGIWSLSFDSECRQRCLQEQGCLEGLRKLEKSEFESVRKMAKGALWNLEGEKMHLDGLASAAPTTKRYGHIMISYNWGVQEEVFKLRDFLRSNGYKIWIDTEKMKGSTLDAMSRAVEGADVVLICYTEKYKSSPPCRSEAEYTYKRRKPFIPIRMQSKYDPDGWLGMLIGNEIFYDLTRPEMYQKKLDELLKQLGDRGKHGSLDREQDDVDDDSSGSGYTNRVDPVTQTRPNITVFKCLGWSCNDVMKWLISNKLSNYTHCLETIDGPLLAELAYFHATAPEAYSLLMRDEVKVSLIDLLKFNKALRQLENE